MTARILTGLEVLMSQNFSRLKGKKIGLLCHPASVDQKLRHTADILFDAGLNLTMLFGPEHGIRGAAQDMISVAHEVDARLSLPVVSLYGQDLASLKPPTEKLSDIEVLVVDLQDIGSRYYTFIWTMVLAMQSCAAKNITMVVLDRPNPLGGEVVEGPLIREGYFSFVGLLPVCVRHGLTIGEVARWAKNFLQLKVDLQVVPMRGWCRSMFFEETELPWVFPSPNMPSIETAFIYPGGCLLEGTQLSEGRGTTRPFEIFGAPYVDAMKLQEAMSKHHLAGVDFRPLTFIPTFHKHAGQVCGGLQIHLSSRRFFSSLLTGVAILRELWRLWPQECAWRKQAYEFVTDVPAIDLLAGGDWLRRGVQEGYSLGDLSTWWHNDEQEFLKQREPFLLY